MLHPLSFTGKILVLDFSHWSTFFPFQDKQDELEELNKELRQCNLQQFIQQAGVLPVQTNSRTELQEQLEQFLQDGYRDGSKETKQSLKY